MAQFFNRTAQATSSLIVPLTGRHHAGLRCSHGLWSRDGRGGCRGCGHRARADHLLGAHVVAVHHVAQARLNEHRRRVGVFLLLAHDHGIETGHAVQTTDLVIFHHAVEVHSASLCQTVGALVRIGPVCLHPVLHLGLAKRVLNLSQANRALLVKVEQLLCSRASSGLLVIVALRGKVLDCPRAEGLVRVDGLGQPRIHNVGTDHITRHVEIQVAFLHCRVQVVPASAFAIILVDQCDLLRIRHAVARLIPDIPLLAGEHRGRV